MHQYCARVALAFCGVRAACALEPPTPAPEPEPEPVIVRKNTVSLEGIVKTVLSRRPKNPVAVMA